MLVALSALKFKFVNIHFTNKVFTWHENVPFNFMMTNKHWQKHFKRILITFALKYPYCWLIMWVRLIGHSWHFPQHNSAVSPIFKQRHLFFHKLVVNHESAFFEWVNPNTTRGKFPPKSGLWSWDSWVNSKIGQHLRLGAVIPPRRHACTGKRIDTQQLKRMAQNSKQISKRILEKCPPPSVIKSNEGFLHVSHKSYIKISNIKHHTHKMTQRIFKEIYLSSQQCRDEVNYGSI